MVYVYRCVAETVCDMRTSLVTHYISHSPRVSPLSLTLCVIAAAVLPPQPSPLLRIARRFIYSQLCLCVTFMRHANTPHMLTQFRIKRSGLNINLPLEL